MEAALFCTVIISLKSLVVIVDYNKLQGYGYTRVSESEPFPRSGRVLDLE